MPGLSIPFPWSITKDRRINLEFKQASERIFERGYSNKGDGEGFKLRENSLAGLGNRSISFNECSRIDWGANPMAFLFPVEALTSSILQIHNVVVFLGDKVAS